MRTSTLVTTGVAVVVLFLAIALISSGGDIGALGKSAGQRSLLLIFAWFVVVLVIAAAGWWAVQRVRRELQRKKLTRDVEGERTSVQCQPRVSELLSAVVDEVDADDRLRVGQRTTRPWFLIVTPPGSDDAIANGTSASAFLREIADPPGTGRGPGARAITTDTARISAMVAADAVWLDARTADATELGEVLAEAPRRGQAIDGIVVWLPHRPAGDDARQTRSLLGVMRDRLSPERGGRPVGGQPFPPVYIVIAALEQCSGIRTIRKALAATQSSSDAFGCASLTDAGQLSAAEGYATALQRFDGPLRTLRVDALLLADDASERIAVLRFTSEWAALRDICREYLHESFRPEIGRPTLEPRGVYHVGADESGYWFVAGLRTQLLADPHIVHELQRLRSRQRRMATVRRCSVAAAGIAITAMLATLCVSLTGATAELADLKAQRGRAERQAGDQAQRISVLERDLCEAHSARDASRRNVDIAHDYWDEDVQSLLTHGGAETLQLHLVLSPTSADALASWGKGDSNARRLVLHGVTSLDVGIARRLAKWGAGDTGYRCLRFTSLESLNTEVARTLARWGNGDSGTRVLDLGAVTSLDAAVADALADWGQGDTGKRVLVLSGPTALAGATAQALVNWSSGDAAVRGLYLNGLTSLDIGIAEVLANWGTGDPGLRGLYLEGLTAIEATIATALVKWGEGDAARRGLHLNGLTQLNVPLASALARWGKGDTGHRELFLNGLNSLDAVTAQAVVAWGKGDTGLRKLGLNGLSSLDAATAQAIVAWGEGDTGSRSLGLDGLSSLETASASAMVKWGKGDAAQRFLHLNGLTQLDVSLASVLAGWGKGDTEYRSLFLNGLISLDAVAARALVAWGKGDTGHRWLNLNGLPSLDAGLANELASWGKGDSGARWLYLNGVTGIETAVAQALATFGRGDTATRGLRLHGLTSLDAASAQALSAWRRANNRKLEVPAGLLPPD